MPIDDAPVTADRSPVRLDIWLDVACLFKTRSEAQHACKGGKVDVNGQTGRPNRLLHEGDEIVISRGHGRKQRVLVLGLARQHVAKADARRLYNDVTPPPTAEEVEMRRMERLFHRTIAPRRAPDKRAKRELRRLKERG